jgi:formylmethanofuran dehydrogenase subunit B
VLHGAGLAATTGGDANALALHALVRDLARVAHVVALPLRHHGNARGAEDVLAWQTGYPSAVSLARGHPRSLRGEFSAAAVLERGEPDAALVVGADTLEHLPPGAAHHLRGIPTVVVGPRATEDSEPTHPARVALATAASGVHREGTAHRMDGVPVPLRAPATAASGVHREGTAHRMDGVPVPLRAPLHSPLAGDAEVLTAIAARIAEDGQG